ncbi:hypothetical protein AS034_16240 [[Bacillus] enclensis]|uniref:Peptidoglycan/LPS O-acetylase OafA/YrhL, contains acyltransferase and SGNH-hydrolase domains n=1 Tax=[Bacillus] enclensis TaxID=1402860 RepID=A0A0V8HD72_9BACI|nr:acyltransferase [[Bacillus] enclensis]KSU60391.1 hypothetical protein AS034_16240 [[Bacillus] enclensis]SCC23977.1 Peptidoglycan/LPS O-acetylase OafA/YrhL, contains acyltransferase and SGNH-hydrolase domains [[Bacillus] enclensis]
MSNRIQSLDSLRGIAAFVVIIFHVLLSFSLFYKADKNFEYGNVIAKIFNETPLHMIWGGNEAVLLFFVLSGFVLAIPFQIGKQGSYKNFIIKRFVRIYIPYIAVMTLSVVLMVSLYEYKDATGLSEAYENRWNHDVTWRAILAYIFMINYDTANVNGVVWTLYHEMRVSLIFPLLMVPLLKLKPIKALMVLSAGVIFSLIITISPFLLLGRSDLTLIIRDFGFTAYYSVFFILGAFISTYRRVIVEWTSAQSEKFRLLMFVVSIFLINGKWVVNIIPIKSTLLLYSPLSGIGIGILFIVVLSSPLANRLLTVKPLLFLGKISYSLYLTHVLVIMLTTIAFEQIGHVMWAFILSPIASIPVAYLAFRAFELPSMQLASRYSRKVKERKNALEISKVL